MTPTPALALTGLMKAYGRHQAVAGVSLSVQPGEIYALLGPNGAGKTTTLRMAAGLLGPDSGGISVFGVDALADSRAAKQLMAWLPDEPLLYDRLSALEYLEFVASLWSVPRTIAAERAEQLLRLLDLWDVRNQRCEAYSRGMKQKAALAGALVHEPKLMLLDEPLTGLDAQAARLVKDILRTRVQASGAVVVTTHILDVAERIADRIGIIARGQLIAEGSLAALQAQAGTAGGTLEEVFLRLTATPEAV